MGLKEKHHPNNLNPRIEKSPIKNILKTDRLLEKIYYLYSELANGDTKLISGEKLIHLLDNFNPMLAKPTSEDPDGILQMIAYVAPRLPQEVFTSDANVVIKFNDDPDYFLPDSKSKKIISNGEKRKRWYSVERHESRKNNKSFNIPEVIITIHAQSQTAIKETFVHLAIIEKLRSQLRSLIKNSSTSNLKSLSYMWRTAGYIAENDSAIKMSQWINHGLVIKKSNAMPYWNELKYSSKTAIKLAKLAEKNLQKNRPPSGIFFGNSFSLINILSHYLLNEIIGAETEERSLRNHIVDQAIKAWNKNRGKIINKSPLEVLGETLSSYKKFAGPGDKDFLQFLTDNAIIYDLCRGKVQTSDPIINQFIAKFKDQKKLEKLGIETIIKEEQSPSADPVYYIDFSKVDDEVIDNLNPMLKGSIKRLREKNIALIFTPYAPGDLTYSITDELKKIFPSINSIIEVGKIGHVIVNEEDHIEPPIGHLMRPTVYSRLYNDPHAYDFDNQVSDLRMQQFSRDRFCDTVLFQGPTVVLQDKQEIHQVITDLSSYQKLPPYVTVNMEVDEIADISAELDLARFEVDYVSDKVATPEQIKVAMKNGITFQNIVKALDRKGRHGVLAGTAAVICSLADSLN